MYETVWIGLELCDRLGVLSNGKTMKSFEERLFSKDGGIGLGWRIIGSLNDLETLVEDIWRMMQGSISLLPKM